MAGQLRCWWAVCLICCVMCITALAADQPSISYPPMRQPWQPASAGFIRQWLICGQFSVSADGGYEADLLSDQGGEAAIAPKAGMVHKGTDGAEYRWIAYDAPADVVDIAVALKSAARENSVTYAYATLQCDQDKGAVLALGSDDGVILFVNGQRVFTHIIDRAVVPDDDVVEIDLKKGENRLLFKIQNTVGGVGVCARLTDLNTVAMREAKVHVAPSTDTKTLSVGIDSPIFLQAPNLGPVQLDLVAAGGRVAATKSLRRGEVATFDTSAIPDGSYELACSGKSPDGKAYVTYTPWYKGDLIAAAKRVVASARSADANDLTTPLLAEMISDRFAGKLDTATQVPPRGLAAVQSAVMEAEELHLDSGKGSQIRPSGFIRLAYIDEVDNSVQFCRAYLPRHYDPAKKWPMVVNLHGYNPPNPRYIGWWSVDQRHNTLADNYDVIVIEPHGRGNTSYQGFGRQDVLHCIDMAKTRFSVDADRVLLLGYSMGGWGTWHVGTRHPDLFAAIAPVYGGADYHSRDPAETLAKATPFRRFAMERDSSFAQADALWTTPIFINHGDADQSVPVDFSRYAQEMLARWGYNVRYWEHPGLGHGLLGCEDELMTWFLQLRRANPTQVRLRAAELKTARSHWLAVTQRENPTEFILGEARIIAPNTILLSTQNALEITLSPAGLIDPAKPLQVLWNGKPARSLAAEDGRYVLRDESYSPAGLVKTPEVEGPISDLANTPYAIIVGTVSTDPMMRATCRIHAQKTVAGWEDWQKVKPRIFDDVSVSEADLSRYSLILIGGPEANLVTRKLSGRIPLKIEGSTVTIGGRSFDAPNAAVGMIYPSPLNPHRYVQVCAATSPMAQFHHFDTNDMVDFYIVDGRLGDWREGVPDEKVLIASGYFDNHWQYSEKLTMLGDAKLRAEVPVRKQPVYLSAPGNADRLMLSELLESQVLGSFNDMKRDLNNNCKPLTLAGRTYKSGLGVNIWREQVCAIDFDLANAGYKHLRSTIGIEMDEAAKITEEQKQKTRVIFIAYGDGKEIYRSEPFAWDTAPKELDVDITGVKTLRLEVTGNAAGNGARSVDWADVRVER